MHLARTLHDDAAAARQVANAALDRLPAAVVAQDKRIYYAGQTTKVWLSEEQLLQQLVFAASDRVERAEESSSAVGSSALLVRFLKHLVWISTRRNVFYVTLAVGRLLYGFTTQQTADLYCLLFENNSKDDAYYRARKRVLIGEMSRRFPSAVRVTARTRGEQTFAMTRADAGTRGLIEQCLDAFAPWGTSCGRESSDPLQLMHRLLHPPCFRALTSELAWPDPLPRLQVPRFAAGARGPSGSQGTWDSPQRH